MASGRLATKVIVPYDTDPVYTVPNGINKVAFSLISQGFNEADVAGTVIYKGSETTSVYDTTSPTALNSFTTAQTVQPLEKDYLRDWAGYPSAMTTTPTGYEFDDLIPVWLSSSKTAWLTYDQKHVWDSVTSIWRSANTEYGAGEATYVIVKNEYDTWSSDDFGLILISDNTSNPEYQKSIYPTSPTTFSTSGYGYWFGYNLITGFVRNGRAANLQYSIDNSGNLHLTTGYQTAYFPSSSNVFAGGVYANNWSVIETQVSGGSETGWVARLAVNRAVFFENTSYKYSNALTTWTDGSWNFVDPGYSTAGFTPADVVIYPVSDTQFIVFDPGLSGNSAVHHIKTDAISVLYYVSGFEGIPKVVSGFDSGFYVKNTLDVLYKATTPYTTSSGDLTVAEANIVGDPYVKTELYTSYDVSRISYSPSLSAGLAGDAFDNSAWLFIPNNTTVTLTYEFDIAPGTYDSLSGDISISDPEQIAYQFTVNQDSIVDSEFVNALVNFSPIELKTGYIEIANSSVSESFSGSTVEITGRMISANDSIIVYTDKPTKVTVMGIEEE
jgi:hypothetical protein